MFLTIDIRDKLEIWFNPNSKSRESFYVTSVTGETNPIRKKNLRQKKNSSMLWLLFSLYSIIYLVERPAWRFVCWISFFECCKLEGTSRSPAKCSSIEVPSFFQQHRSRKCIKCCRSHQNISFVIGVVDIMTHKMVWNIQKWHQILLHARIHS